MNILRKRWYIILIILLLIGVFIFKLKFNLLSQSTKVSTYTIKRQNLKETLDLSGEIDSEEKVTLRFQSSGRLTWVGVKEGDYVKKYQGIASLDTQELQKNLKKYLNTYMSTRWDFETTKDEKDIKNIGGLNQDLREAALRTLDKAQFDLNNAVIDVELKNIALQYAYLYTPIEGIVVSVSSPYAGVNITPSQAEFIIINPKTIFFSATADQADVVKMREEMIGEIILDAYPDKSIQGVIKTISFIPKSGETGTVYRIKLNMNIDNINYQYRHGMTGDISFVVKERNNVLSVPTNYLKTTNNKKSVFKKVNNQKVKTNVTIGEEIDGTTIITSGLNESDIIYDL